MPDPHSVDGVLMKWGDRLFYPGNRMVKATSDPRLATLGGNRAAVIRARIAAMIVRRAPQVMVKVTGGGRGMKAIAAHFRYISKNGRLPIEDERGQLSHGKDAVREMVEDWRYGGSMIEEASHRREAFNIMLSMPRGVDAITVQRAAREFAKAELADHKYVMVLHEHQANPHVHLSVRAESMHARRLNPRKADLQRWRETFAQELRARGVDAEATRRVTRGQSHVYSPLWRLKARAEGRERCSPLEVSRRGPALAQTEIGVAWNEIARALLRSSDSADRAMGRAIAEFLAHGWESREARPYRPEQVPRLRYAPPEQATGRIVTF